MNRQMMFTGIVLLSVGHARGAVIFTNNFDSGPSALWGDEVGNWNATGGAYRAGSPFGSHPLRYSSLPFDLTDFSFQVDITDIGDGGIWVRSQDNRNGVLLVTGGKASGITAEIPRQVAIFTGMSL